MQISINLADHVLQRYGNMLGALGAGQAHKALARAVNRVTNTVHGRVIRAVAKQSSIPTAIVRRTVKKRTVKPGSGDALEGLIWATGKPLSLKYFKPRQTKAGTVATVWGKRTLYASAFMGPRPGAVARKLKGHVWVRTSAKRLPIEIKYGPSVPEELVANESARVFEATVQDMLPKRVAHEIGRLLPG